MRRPNKIGVISAAGDRRDGDIIELGRMVGETFDEMIIKEDKNTRGRAPGEIGELLYKGMLEAGMRDNEITVIPDEMEATQAAMERAKPGDLVVLFADDVGGVWDQVTKLNRCVKTV